MEFKNKLKDVVITKLIDTSKVDLLADKRKLTVIDDLKISMEKSQNEEQYIEESDFNIKDLSSIGDTYVGMGLQGDNAEVRVVGLDESMVVDSGDSCCCCCTPCCCTAVAVIKLAA